MDVMDDGGDGSLTFNFMANWIAFLCSSDGFSKCAFVFSGFCDCHLLDLFSLPGGHCC